MGLAFFEISEKLDRFFSSKGLTSYRVSKESGISEPTISRYRKGKSQPTTSKLKVLLDTFPDLENYIFGSKIKEGEQNIINLNSELEELKRITPPQKNKYILDQIPKEEIIKYIKDNEADFDADPLYNEMIKNKAKDIAINLLIEKLNDKN